MAYTVVIKYIGVEQDVTKVICPVCRIFKPDNSYIDSPAYTQGIPVDAEEGDRVAGKSIYATNVDGWGSVDLQEPYASTSVPFPTPLAQFKLAVVGEDNEVTFDVDDYKEAFYYQQLGEQMKDQGFEVTVTKK